MNELHFAAGVGSAERTIAVLSRGVVSVDHSTPVKGRTPLMLAASFGHTQVVNILLNRGANVALADYNGFAALHHAAGFGHTQVVNILLNRGANVALVDYNGFAALHLTAHRGFLAVTKLLVEAGADLEATTPSGSTPLHLASEKGYSEVMRVLIEAGANPNSRAMDGATPLCIAANDGHVGAIKVLLRAGAEPLLTFSNPGASPVPLDAATNDAVPLDAAANNGHLAVARELIQHFGIEGCGGASGGVQALQAAAQEQHLEIMGLLTSTGVVDTGLALRAAAVCGQERSMKFLLQQQEWKASGQGDGYLDAPGRFGATPLVCSIQACRLSCSPRIMRLLVDAGADTTTTVRLAGAGGDVFFDDTPLALADLYLRNKKINGEDATESQLHSVEAARRLLMRVEAVHAVSWLWASDVPSFTYANAEGTGGATEATSTPLMLMMPILRRRAGRPRVLLAALFRNSKKP